MIDRWYYTHAGQTLGPVTAAQLRQLATSGLLAPNDLIWPEGGQQSGGVPAQAAIDFAAPARPAPSAPPAPLPPTKPDWIDDIRTAIKTEKEPAPSGQPDWLDDVRAAEAAEQEMLTLEWDGDNAEVEEELASQLLDELEEIPGSEAKKSASRSHAPRGNASSPSCRLVIGSASTRGRARDRNEDSVLVQQCSWSNLDERHDVALIVVADGMGGHQAGDRASGLVLRALGKVLTPLLTAALNELSPQASPADPSEVLDGGLIEANRLVRETSQRNPAWKGMGSTAVALLIWDGKTYIRLVGDCRVYHWRGGKLTQVTHDQTLVARMVELGQLTPQEAAKHPRRNEVAQAVGKYALLEPARYELALGSGDWLVASSDGLQAHVSDRTLGEAIAKAGASADELANRLVELANQGGGSDNCTVVTVRCA
ncbi:MAG TPA: GYF domain-containing protein [Gemmataceae bacterium]|nr:GYF domain-containing protein [Gemmataceae bacterium]